MQFFNTISNNRVLGKHGLKIAWSVAGIGLLWLITGIGYDIYSQSKLKATHYAAQKLPPIKQANRYTYQTNDIVGANLFGDPNPKPVVKAAPTTTLNLTLQGVLWATDSSIARAIIMSGNKKSELYSIGEQIAGAGASVKEIRSSEVILNRSGAAESLPLLKKTTSGNRQLITYNDPSFNFSGLDPDYHDLIPDNFEGFDLDMLENINPEIFEHIDPELLESLEAMISGEEPTTQSTPRPNSPNGEPRKIRKPNFSGLDRALKKMDEI